MGYLDYLVEGEGLELVVLKVVTFLVAVVVMRFFQGEVVRRTNIASVSHLDGLGNLVCCIRLGVLAKCSSCISLWLLNALSLLLGK